MLGPETDPYRAALEFLYSRANYERGFLGSLDPLGRGLERTTQLLKRLGWPQDRLKIVHIAGTKGKGSVAAMVASVLWTRYPTGLFTSPHLHTFRERIQVDGSPISPVTFSRLVAQLRSIVADLDGQAEGLGRLTTFELATALGLLHFARVGAEWAVVEVGLGGRLDATNVVAPEVAIITSLSYDHTQILGSTLAQIAAEKAGIIKTGVPVVCAPQEAEAVKVIEERARALGATLLLADRDWSWSGSRQNLTVHAPFETYGGLEVALLGPHQLENAAVAVATIDLLRAQQRVDLGREEIRLGLKQVRWPGRVEILRRNPTVVVDGAHNGESAEFLARTLKGDLTYNRLFLILGTSADKDIGAIVGALAPLADFVGVTRSRHPRAAPPEVLAREFARFDHAARIFPEVGAALGEFLGRAGPEDLICVTGSLYLVAEAREFLGAPGSEEKDPVP